VIERLEDVQGDDTPPQTQPPAFRHTLSLSRHTQLLSAIAFSLKQKTETRVINYNSPKERSSHNNTIFAKKKMPFYL
jgi:hypothetical protein